jgi:hypothetical protein
VGVEQECVAASRLLSFRPGPSPPSRCSVRRARFTCTSAHVSTHPGTLTTHATVGETRTTAALASISRPVPSRLLHVKEPLPRPLLRTQYPVYTVHSTITQHLNPRRPRTYPERDSPRQARHPPWCGGHGLQLRHIRLLSPSCPRCAALSPRGAVSRRHEHPHPQHLSRRRELDALTVPKQPQSPRQDSERPTGPLHRAR